jgi:hypothetical protein
MPQPNHKNYMKKKKKKKKKKSSQKLPVNGIPTNEFAITTNPGEHEPTRHPSDSTP